jgi:fermentation-respiration switch protein FrsA (DUF1100 family)
MIVRRASLSLSVLLPLVLVAGCTLDSFLFNGRRVEEYRWDEADPALDGELTDPHPSIVPAADRLEGFLDADVDGVAVPIHWVFAHRSAPTATIVYSHGNRAHLGRYWDRVERMWSRGYAVLIYDYPGYGRSGGTTSEAGVLAAGVGALDHVLTLPDVDPDRIVALGYSLGGAPAYHMAARAARGEAPRLRAMISESTFCSVAALVEDGSFLDLAPGYFASARLDNCARIAELGTMPVLIVHGLADDFVVPRHAEMLIEAASTMPSTLLVPGADHGDIPLVDGESYDRAIDEHIAAALALPL